MSVCFYCLLLGTMVTLNVSALTVEDDESSLSGRDKVHRSYVPFRRIKLYSSQSRQLGSEWRENEHNGLPSAMM
jgi:hypothetical protein